MLDIHAEMRRHKEYLDLHEDDFPFPLDGSDWARLVSMRIERAHHCNCNACEDLISKIHNDGGPIAREHKVEERAKAFWRDSESVMETPVIYTSQPTMEEEALSFALAHEGLIEACIEAEKAAGPLCTAAGVSMIEKIEAYRKSHSFAEFDADLQDETGE